MEHSDELRDLTLRFYEAAATGDLSFFDQHVSRQEGAVFIGTDPDEWWEGLEAFREAMRVRTALPLIIDWGAKLLTTPSLARVRYPYDPRS
jgi:ketosteroid isomerase-like protein